MQQTQREIPQAGCVWVRSNEKVEEVTTNEVAVSLGAAIFDRQSSQHAVSEHNGLLSSDEVLWNQ